MSYKNLISEVLSAHADRLLAEQAPGQDYIELFPENEDLPPLLFLADNVKAALTPVQPPQTFKEQLQRELMAAAYLRQAEQQAQPQTNISFLPVALITSLVAMSSLLLFFWRYHRLHSNPA